MSNGGLWQVIGNTALPRPVNSVIGTTPALSATGAPAYGMLATPDNAYIVTMSGNGNVYLYDATADTYVTGRLLFNPIQGYYGVLGARGRQLFHRRWSQSEPGA